LTSDQARVVVFASEDERRFASGSGKAGPTA